MIECIEGPLNGKRVGNRGDFWRPVVEMRPPPEPDEPGGWQLSLDDPAPIPAPPSEPGTYVLERGVYVWHPDSAGGF